MTKVIIAEEFDYADEFDYPVCSVITAHFRDLMLDAMKYFPNGSEEYYFGTNEALDFERSDIEDMLGDAQIITQDELNVLKKFDVMSGMDVIEYAFDTLIEAMEEIGDLDDEIFELHQAYKEC